MNMPTPAEVLELVERIKPLLAGKAPTMIGATLAELTAIWLAGHIVAGNRNATREMRARLLAFHFEHLLELVAVEDGKHDHDRRH